MAQPRSATPIRVRLVTAHDCHLCDHARSVLGRLQAELPLAIEEVPLASPEGRALAARHGILFPPGLLLDGDFVGFGRISERRLRAQLEKRL
jgi:hypothetical protein